MVRWRGFVAIFVLLTACGGGDAEPTSTPPAQSSRPAATSEPAPTSRPATTTAPESTTAPEGVDAPGLAGTSWTVDDYSQGPGMITNVWKTEVTIAFGADGTVSGSAGCNDYQARWQVSGPYDEFESGVRDPDDGQILIFEDLSWTERACEDADVMEQEAEILDLLQRAGRWVLIRGEFNLRDADGAFLFAALAR
ncbi:MAG TPA: META domain-containing protein [Acidimicrobiia bacterium]|nr:META domain-containing protein [Acidimicrobiia bacterium]